jgi:hypothetical protein
MEKRLKQSDIIKRWLKMVNLSKIGKGRHITYHHPKEVLDIDIAELLGLHVGDDYMSRGTWGIRCNISRRKHGSTNNTLSS